MFFEKAENRKEFLIIPPGLPRETVFLSQSARASEAGRFCSPDRPCGPSTRDLPQHPMIRLSTIQAPGYLLTLAPFICFNYNVHLAAYIFHAETAAYGVEMGSTRATVLSPSSPDLGIS